MNDKNSGLHFNVQTTIFVPQFNLISMLNFENAQLCEIVIHNVGNQFTGGQLSLSLSSFTPSDPDILMLLKNYFLSSFKSDAYFKFSVNEEAPLNPIEESTKAIFSDRAEFFNESIHIAEQLFASTKNPNIKSGELYVVYFTGCQTDEGVCDAIGIFKSEKKDTFLKVIVDDDTYKISQESGINIKKLDKACLIYNLCEDEGYKISILDKTNSKEALYWTHEFLGLEPRFDNYYQTSAYLNLCRDFIGEVYNSDNNISRAEQVDLVNRSLNFFKEEEVFNEDKFKEDVMKESDVIAAFEAYKDIYIQDESNLAAKSFSISNYALKDQKRQFKQVLQLDKNFKVHILGERKYITKGYDSDVDMNYYKLYFYEER